MDAPLSSLASECWQRLSEWQGQPPAALVAAFTSLASSFCSALLTEPVMSMTSAFILGWAEQGRQLLRCLPPLRQRLVDAMLPQHEQLLRLMQEAGEEERLRVAVDCVRELLRGLGTEAATELLHDRCWLLADLLTADARLAWLTRSSAAEHDYGSSDQPLLRSLQAAFLPSVVALLLQSSTVAGEQHAAALCRLLCDADSGSSSSFPPQSPSVALLFIRSVLLPLAGRGDAVGLPSSFSSLLPLLVAALPQTLTPAMAQTVAAFAGCRAAFLPLQPLSSSVAVSQPLAPHADVLLRGLLSEAERACTEGRQTEAALQYQGSLLVSLSALLQHSPSVPAFAQQAATRLLVSGLPASLPAERSAATAHFLYGRCSLCAACWRWLPDELGAAAASSASSAPAAAVRRLLSFTAEALQVSLTAAAQDRDGELRVSASSFAWLEPMLLLLHSALPALLASASLLSIDLLPVMRPAYQLLSSALLPALSVTLLETALGRLAATVLLYLQRVPGAIDALIAHDFASPPSASSSLSPLTPPAFSLSSPLSRLFRLLSHPFPAVSLHVRGLLSVGLLHRAVSIPPPQQEEESLAAVQRELRDEGAEDEAGEEADRPGGADGDEGGRKEARRRRRRLQRERRRVREEVSRLLPAQLQSLLEWRLDSASAAPAAGLLPERPLGLQLRGWLLGFSLLLDLLHCSLPLSSASLSDAQRAVLVAYLRDCDAFSPFLSELTHHILSASSPQQRDAWLQPAADSLRPQLTEETLLPAPPSEDEPQRATARAGSRGKGRSQQLQQAEAEQAVYLPQLSCLLYLQWLHLLPALSRAWFTNVERASAPLLQRLTAQHFSPLLIRYELRAATALPLPAPADGAAASSSSLSLQGNAAACLLSARYSSGEVQMTLLLRLHPAHPLLPVSVEFADKVKVSDGWLRRWQLSVASALLSGNGGLQAAVTGWARNLDQHFAGATECPICYAVVHAVQGTLPRMQCKTCGNRFHANCLFTWFEKSGHSSCPLCRTSF